MATHTSRGSGKNRRKRSNEDADAAEAIRHLLCEAQWLAKNRHPEAVIVIALLLAVIPMMGSRNGEIVATLRAAYHPSGSEREFYRRLNEKYPSRRPHDPLDDMPGLIECIRDLDRAIDKAWADGDWFDP